MYYLSLNNVAKGYMKKLWIFVSFFVEMRVLRNDIVLYIWYCCLDKHYRFNSKFTHYTTVTVNRIIFPLSTKSMPVRLALIVRFSKREKLEFPRENNNERG